MATTSEAAISSEDNPLTEAPLNSTERAALATDEVSERLKTAPIYRERLGPDIGRHVTTSRPDRPEQRVFVNGKMVLTKQSDILVRDVSADPNSENVLEVVSNPAVLKRRYDRIPGGGPDAYVRCQQVIRAYHDPETGRVIASTVVTSNPQTVGKDRYYMDTGDMEYFAPIELERLKDKADQIIATWGEEYKAAAALRQILAAKMAAEAALAQKEKAREALAEWRERHPLVRRIVGAVAVAAVALSALWAASTPGRAQEGRHHAAPVATASPHLSNPASQIAELDPDHKPTQTEKPALHVEAPNLWTMFAEAYGPENATKELLSSIGQLENNGYTVNFYPADPRMNTTDTRPWWFTVTGADGTVYSGASLKHLLANG